jgi:hypothetical protein
MTANDRKRFRNWQDGRHPQVGNKVFGPIARMSKGHQNEQSPETPGMASTMVVRLLTETASSKRLSKWNT